MADEYVGEEVKRKYRRLDDWAEEIGMVIDEYRSKGVEKITVRQLFYRLVSTGFLENTAREYNTMIHALSKLRLEGVIPDEVFVDETRIVDEFYEPEIWRDQKFYVELWVEKATLRGVVSDIARIYHVNMFTCRGYPSRTALVEALNRFRRAGKPVVVLYIGDFDPTGEDIPRFVEDFFLANKVDFRFEKIAVLPEHIEQYGLPPIPAKKSDRRYREFVNIYGGDRAVEVEALPPDVLLNIVREAIVRYIEPSLFAKFEIDYAVKRIARTIAMELVKNIVRVIEALAEKVIERELSPMRDALEAAAMEKIRRGESVEIPIELDKILEDVKKKVEKGGLVF